MQRKDEDVWFDNCTYKMDFGVGVDHTMNVNQPHNRILKKINAINTNIVSKGQDKG